MKIVNMLKLATLISKILRDRFKAEKNLWIYSEDEIPFSEVDGEFIFFGKK